jgi:hypothetical protein
MTYFSDFETTEYMYDDYNSRQNILRDVEENYEWDSSESVPMDLIEELEQLQ